MTQTELGDRIAGTALIAAGAAAALAMAHHPTSAHNALNGPVHGAMIALVAVLGFGFLHFARRRGLDRPAVLAGLTGYAVSLFAHVGAATTNGFVLPALARGGHAAVSHDVVELAWASNQALAGLGVFATGAAYLLWGADLLGRRGWEARAVGALGIAAGVVPAALLATGALRMDVSGALIVYLAHLGWAALVGVQLWRGRIAE